jgi:hypothetical protein
LNNWWKGSWRMCNAWTLRRFSCFLSIFLFGFKNRIKKRRENENCRKMRWWKILWGEWNRLRWFKSGVRL